MKYIPAGVLAAALVFFSAGSSHALETYLLDYKTTTLAWSMPHSGSSVPSGSFAMVQGALNLDEAALENSKVFAVVKLADMTTGVDTIDTQLKSEKFFDADHYPSAGFVSNKVEVTGKDTAKIYGMMTIHGISKPAILDAKLTRRGENAEKKKTIAFHVSALIKRSDFAIGPALQGFGDDVRLSMEAYAIHE